MAGRRPLGNTTAVTPPIKATGPPIQSTSVLGMAQHAGVSQRAPIRPNKFGEFYVFPGFLMFFEGFTGLYYSKMAS